MPNAEGRARQLSWLYYNQGLEQARARDLTGAANKLRESLQLHKRNIHARNLLGLVYFETGEVVPALCEWLISQRFQSRDNLASEYLSKVQRDKSRLRSLSEASITYNKALENCRAGHDDIAAIQLKRVVSKNPQFIKAAQLLALIYIKDGRNVQAARVLRRILQIDRSDPVTLRYLHETGAGDKSLSREYDADEEAEKTPRRSEPVSRVKGFTGRPAFTNLVNILIGLAIGLLTVGLVAIPAVRRNVSQDTNARIVDYTTTIAEQKDRITNLERQIEESEATVAQAQEQVESTQSEVGSYDSLVQAYNYMQGGNYMRAGDEIAKIDPTKLSAESVEIYNAISGTILSTAYDEYEYSGDVAFYEGNWKQAIEYFEKAVAIDPNDAAVFNLLANAYQNDGQNEKAIEVYQRIIDDFPNTHTAENAAYAILMLGGTPKENSQTDDAAGTGSEESQDEYSEAQDEYSEAPAEENYEDSGGDYYEETSDGQTEGYTEDYTEQATEDYSGETYPE